MSTLSSEKCQSCHTGSGKLALEEFKPLLSQLSQGWLVVQGHHLEREIKFKDFRTALDFVNRVGELAEAEGHHPDIYLAWGKVKVTIWTHSAEGLTRSDFVLAAKIDQL